MDVWLNIVVHKRRAKAGEMTVDSAIGLGCGEGRPSPTANAALAACEHGQGAQAALLRLPQAVLGVVAGAHETEDSPSVADGSTQSAANTARQSEASR